MADYILFQSIGQIDQMHNSLSLFMFVHLFIQFSKSKFLQIRLMLIFYTHLFLNKLLLILKLFITLLQKTTNSLKI